MKKKLCSCFFILIILTLGLTTRAEAALKCITQAECSTRCPLEVSNTCINTCLSSNPETCERTFYFCPYNTFASDFNFLEISSNTDGQVTGEVRFLDDLGAGILNGIEPLSLDGFRRVDVDIHSMTGANAIGQVLVVIDGNNDSLSPGVGYYRKDKSGALIQTIRIPCTMRHTLDGVSTDE